nr:methyltransferase domain-containing protein [Candidatus Dadabacteria bacterium]
MSENSEKYIPALGYTPLTRFYDLVVGLTTREATFKKELIAQLSLTGTSKVLDVACGTGTLALLLKMQYPNVTVVGLDGDSTILNIARKKIKNAGISIQLDKGFSNKLPYRD